ncbi:hypothetical protein MRX96_012974 [Rhipicephalus microplus]
MRIERFGSKSRAHGNGTFPTTPMHVRKPRGSQRHRAVVVDPDVPLVQAAPKGVAEPRCSQTPAETPARDEERQDIDCCKYSPEERHPNCLVIDVPRDDPFYKFFNRKCLEFARVLAGLRPSCTLGPRSQMNIISAYIDAGFVYGSTQEVASRLREFSGGRMKTTPLYRDLGLKDLLPMKTVEADVGCMARPRNLYCFDAGDERVNEQLSLTVMHTLWLREHNKIAKGLQEVNPHWDDETLFQETRHILIAEVQHLTLTEWLPAVLGPDAVKKYGLTPALHGYYDERYNKFHEKLESIRLSKLLRQPYDLYKPGVVDSFALGLVDQQSNRMDPEITTEVTNHLFEMPGDGFGMDLVSLNVQRGRETGIPGYNDFREYCGLPRARDFSDLIGYLPNKTIHRYAQIYKYVILHSRTAACACAKSSTLQKLHKGRPPTV